MNAHFQVGLE